MVGAPKSKLDESSETDLKDITKLQSKLISVGLFKLHTVFLIFNILYWLVNPKKWSEVTKTLIYWFVFVVFNIVAHISNVSTVNKVTAAVEKAARVSLGFKRKI